MKKVLLSLAIVATVAGALMTSCKKEQETVPNENGQTVMNDSQNEVLVKHIIDFKKQVDARKANPGMKSGETMSLEEAMNNVVDLFNVTYTEPMEYYTAAEEHEFSISVPLDAGGQVLVDDVVAAYEQAVAEARDAYHASMLDDKGYRCLMVSVGMQRDGEVSLVFNGEFGSKGTTPPAPQPHINGPFVDGDNWQCGGAYQGKCDDPSIPGSAVEKLNEQLFLKINQDYPTAPAGKRTAFIDDLDFTFSGPDYPGVFYTENLDETCIERMYMNDYYAGEVNNVYRVVPERNNFSLTALYSFGRYYVISATVSYKGRLGTDPYHKHETRVLYGRSCYVDEDMFMFEEL